MSLRSAAYVLPLFAAFLASVGASPGEDLWALYAKRDFFSLHNDLPPPAKGEPAQISFLRAETLAAFGHFEESSLVLRALLQAHALRHSLERSARLRLMLNERAMFRYAAASAALAPLHPERQPALKNRNLLLSALDNVAPEALRGMVSSIELRLDRFGAVQATIRGKPFRLGIDTAANFSVLSRSAARAAGLQIIPVGYRVRSSTDKAIRADVATGELHLAGGLAVSNVVFLVLPASALRLSAERGLDGLIGFPVLSQISPIKFDGSRVLVLRALQSPAAAQPIALIEGDPAMRVSVGARLIFCRLDTGANRTVFYGRPAGRNRARESSAVISIAGRNVRIKRPLFSARSAANQPYIDCNLGRDALQQLEPYTLDLRNMKIATD